MILLVIINVCGVDACMAENIADINDINPGLQ